MNDSIVVQPRKACPCGSKKITDLGFSITVEQDISRMHVCDACKLVFGIHKKPVAHDIINLLSQIEHLPPPDYWMFGVDIAKEDDYVIARHGDSADDRSTKDNEGIIRIWSKDSESIL